MKQRINNLREKTGRHKTLIQNFSYLSALQVFNMLLPLITYPYLIRVLGIETYGLVVFAQAIVGYLVILVGFGFNISATKEVSIHRDNKAKLSEIVSSVLILKSGLFLLTLLILLALIFLIPQAQEYKTLFFLTMWMCVYDVIFPMWYFQGIEKMKHIAYLTLVSRLIFLGLIFVFIHSPEDYLFIPIINGIGAILAGSTSLFIVFGNHQLSFAIQPYKLLEKYLIDSIPIFISNLSVQIYLATNKIFAGLFLGLSEVAYYDLGEKILNLFKIPIGIVTQVIFPKMSKLYDKIFLKKTIGFVFLIVLVGVIVFLFVANDFVVLFAGENMLPAADVAKILIISLLPLILSNGLGIQILLAQGYNKQYTEVVLQTTLLYFILAVLLILTNQLSIYSLPLISIAIELFMLFRFFSKCKKHQLL